MTPLLDVRNLGVTYASGTRAVDYLSFTVEPGECVALVGESGSGKSSVGLALMRLLDRDAASIAKGSSVLFEGTDLLSIDDNAMRAVRGRRMSMVFQEPAAALNPSMRVGRQIAEVARIHGERSGAAAMTRAIAMMERVGIPEPAQRARAYPHELSGGLRQRVVIAMALLLGPALVIADEPTSALDVTVQAQILDLLVDLQREFGTAVLLITHDLGIVAEVCTRALVMRRGTIVEQATVEQLFASPSHEYTRGLLRAVPRLRLPA